MNGLDKVIAVSYTHLYLPAPSNIRLADLMKEHNISPVSDTHLDVYKRQGSVRSVGVDDGEVPPVPIPNTEVKLTCAEDSSLETARENR